jgi:uncharacterized membrane protein
VILLGVWGVAFFAAPALFLFIAKRVSFVSKLGTIVLAYGLGLLVGNLGILPDGIASVQDLVTTLTVPLALPLIFFSLDLSRWRTLARKAALSLFAGILAVALGSLVTFLIFRSSLGEEGWKAAGMLVGVYTGGTPNLAAIGTALQTSPEVYVSVHGSDVIAGAVLLLILVTIAPPIVRRLLPRFESETEATDDEVSFSPFFDFSQPGVLRDLLIALGLGLLVFAIGGSFTLFLPEITALPAAMVMITSLGVAASFVPRVRRLRNTFQLGYYLILVFSFAVSSMANVQELAGTAPVILGYVASLLTIVSLLHLLFSWLFRVDADTHLISVTSFVYSPPFVPVVAAAIGNRKVVLSGIAIGVVGWIIGNYLGFAIAYLFRAVL